MECLIGGSLALFFTLLTGSACGFSIWRYCKARTGPAGPSRSTAGIHGWVATWTGLATAALMAVSLLMFPQGVADVSKDPRQILTEIRDHLTHEKSFIHDESQSLATLQENLEAVEVFLQRAEQQGVLLIDRGEHPWPQAEPTEFMDNAYVPLPKKKVN